MPHVNRTRALAICLVAAFMTGLDVSVVNVAVPAIQRGMDASEASVQWILSGYTLTFGLALVPAGRIGDARGRRGMFVFGVALFTVTSAVCGIAWSADVLTVGRFVQGAAAGFVAPQVTALIQQMYPPGEGRGRAFGAFGTTIGLATATGPLIGGGLISLFGDDEGWRAVFFVNVPIGLVLVPLALRLLPGRAAGERRRESLDLVGVLLLGSGVVLLLLPFVENQQWKSDLKWLLVPIAALVLYGFVRWERHYRRETLVDLGLFGFRSYAMGSAIGALYFAGFTGIFFTFTLYLQSGLHYSPLEAGLAITPFAVGSAVGATVSGRLVERMGRRLVAIGLWVVVVGLSAVFVVDALVRDSVGAALALPLLVAGLGSGSVISPNQTVTLSQVPPAQGGSASGVVQTGQRVGSSIGIAAAGVVFFHALPGGFASAFRHALVVVVLFVTAALVVAAYDLVKSRRPTVPVGGAQGTAR